MSEHKQLYRILDANLNRAKEGLRVCEDISRYVWNQASLTKQIKGLRHDLTTAMGKLDMFKVLDSRAVEQDVGRGSIESEFKRKDMAAVFLANAGRVKESLRVLEEVCKLMDASVALKLKVIRYRFYVQEQKAFKKRLS